VRAHTERGHSSDDETRAAKRTAQASDEGLAHLQRAAGNTAVRGLMSRAPALQSPAVQTAPPTSAPPAAENAAKSPVATLTEQVVAGQFKEALLYLNGLPIEYMLDYLEKLGFANASYLLANLGTVAGLGGPSVARLEAAIRTTGIRQTGTFSDLLIPLLDALSRSGLRQHFSDQYLAIRAKVRPPAGGWNTLLHQYFEMAHLGPLVELTVADDAFRVLDFLPTAETNQAVSALGQSELILLLKNGRSADRFPEGDRVKASLDATWRAQFPGVEPPWPKAPTVSGRNVAAMSTMDKLAESIRRSEKYGGAEVSGKLEELLAPASLAMIAGTTILFAVLEMGTGGTAGLVMLGLSALMVGPEVYTIAGDIKAFITTAAGANDEMDLDLAGSHFAKAAVAISIDILIAVLLHKPTKMATPKIQAGARAVGEFLKTAVPMRGQRQLVPALVMAGDGPRFVQASPEQLAVLESTGGPAPAPFEQLSDSALRKLATTDKAAAEALIRRYWTMPKKKLQGKARNGDGTAQYVLEQRINPNDEALRKAQGSDYRPPHTAEVIVTRPGVGEVSRDTLNSGNMTDLEAAEGWPESALLTHTEARAVRNPDLQRGDTMTIMGQYDPCGSCVARMRLAADRLGIRIDYHWMGGHRSFEPMTLVRGPR
jgi:hypothetical protein